MSGPSTRSPNVLPRLQTVESSSAALDAAAVKITGAQTVAGVKTFASSPIGPTPAPGDNTTKLVTSAFVKGAIDALVAGAPGALDTLNEIAAQLATDESAAAALTTAVAAKLAASAVDVDAAMAANSDAKVPSQKAVKTALDGAKSFAAFGIVGDGVADDTAGLVAAARSGIRTVGKPGATYLISASITADVAKSHMDFNGGTIIKKSGASPMTTPAIVKSADDVTIVAPVIDGKRTAGATSYGITCTGGLRGKLIRGRIEHNKASGVCVTAGELDCIFTESNDNVSGTLSADGFECSGGTLRLNGLCSGQANDRNGAYVYSSATKDCEINGRFRLNLIAGVEVRTALGGRSDWLHCDDNQHYGLSLHFDPEMWTFADVLTTNTGVTAGNVSGTGVETFGARQCAIGRIVGRGNQGYTLAVAASDTRGSIMVVGSVDSWVSGETDPAVVVTGASELHFGRIYANGHTMPLSTGETPGADNKVVGGLIHGVNCTYALANLTLARGCRIDRIIGDSCTVSAPYNGLVSFLGAGTTDNEIGRVEYSDARTTSLAVPSLIYADASATYNRVRDYVAGGSRRGAVDLNGTNRFTARHLQRHTQLSSFDSGETWLGTTNNTTPGQFSEGNGGKRVVGSVGTYTTPERTGLAYDLSGMADSDWFRLTLYVENISDIYATPVQFRFMTDVSNYYLCNVSSGVFFANGLQYLWLRKGDFTVGLGSPTWASITRIRTAVRANAAGTFAITFDDLVRLRTVPADEPQHPYTTFTAGASPFVYQSLQLDRRPERVMVQGGTVSKIEVSADSTTWLDTGAIAGPTLVRYGEYLRVTHTAAPTLRAFPA